jgi:integrase
MDDIKKQVAKEPVRIRFKTIKGGNKSIYLDIYTNGKRYYEFLKLYIVPENSAEDKKNNKQMLQMANVIKSQRIVEIQNSTNGLTNTGVKQKANFIAYLQTNNFEPTLIHHLIKYNGDKITFKHITKQYCVGFIDYLNSAKTRIYRMGTSGALSTTSRHHYFTLLNIALNKAVRDEYLQSNPIALIPKQERPKPPDSDREYLTIEEVNKLVDTECVYSTIKMAFLFACFTGLRFSDVKALKWEDIRIDNEGDKYIKIRQKKTDKFMNLPLCEGLKFIPERDKSVKDNENIFPLTSNSYTNRLLKAWATAAGIKKDVTFHIARHTGATLLLSYNIPIEVVSKILGHSNIQTTQIYAKVVDKSMKEAVFKLKDSTHKVI